MCCKFLQCEIVTSCLGISTCLFYVIIIDLVWVTCLLQSITYCFRRSCKIIKKLLLQLDIDSHGDCSTKLFGSCKCCYNDQWLLNGRYFQLCTPPIDLTQLLSGQKIFWCNFPNAWFLETPEQLQDGSHTYHAPFQTEMYCSNIKTSCIHCQLNSETLSPIIVP